MDNQTGVLLFTMNLLIADMTTVQMAKDKLLEALKVMGSGGEL